MRGTDEDFDELTNEVPLLDVFGPLTGANLTKPQKGDFKLFRSHSTYEQLPKCSKNAKFVIILREPHNTFASFYQWETRFIGDLAPYADEITLDNFYNERIAHPDSKYPVPWWTFVESWLRCHKKVNSIIVFYQDLINDFSSQMQRISSFLGVSLTEEEKYRVKYLSSFDYMRANNVKFDLRNLSLNLQNVLSENEGPQNPRQDIPIFVSKGAKRNGREELNESVKNDMKRKWEEIIEAKFGFKSYEEMMYNIKKEYKF